jgi:CRISPR-associated protein Csa1
LRGKELALAGYALAIEAWTGHPVDYGVAIYINLNGESMLGWRVARIDDSLRRAFLDARDRCAEGEDILCCIARL